MKQTNYKQYNQIEPSFDLNEQKALSKYIKDGGWVTEFKKTNEFEGKISEFTNSKYVVAVNNGTISLTLSALALNIGLGDEVIIPNYTMVATPNSFKMIGAKPVFVDVEEETLCIDFDLVKKKINKKTKAIVLVTPNGRYPKVKISEIKKFCKSNNIHLIEDAAQSLGSFYPNGKHIGTEGIFGSFSFSAPKIISTGQGGAIITTKKKLYSKIKHLKDFGRSKGGNDIHDYVGYNFKFTDIQAVVGIEQFKKLKDRIKKKKKIYQAYVNYLSDVYEIEFFKHNFNFTTPWFVDCKVVDRTNLIKFLHNNNIFTRFMYPPLNKQKIFRVKGNFPVSNAIGRTGLWLPSSPFLTNYDVEYICSKIRHFYKNFR
tara:strand:- start:10791 stop:11903 length:1113 start_codon:yes stop_codon:yes gene_type:complete